MDYIIDNFFGLNTAIKDTKVLKAGTSPDSLNWLTTKEKDSIELRRGYTQLGLTNAGTGKVTGLGVGLDFDANEVLFLACERKLKYYDSVADDMVEIGSNTLPVAANGEDVWMQSYQALGGAYVIIGSPNSSVYKVPVSNPASIKDQQTNNYRWNVFHVGQNRVFAGQRNGTVSGNLDKTGLYLSYIDKDQLSDFTQVTGEALVGSGLTYTKTLAAITAKRTAIYVSVTDGVETFKDDRNGHLIGSAGGTGTINYATGDVSVTFAVAPSGAVTADYYWEDYTSAGILDFSGGGNGQGKSFRQDNGGGELMAIYNIGTTEYCFHRYKTWQFESSLDDTTSTNKEYRNIGIPYPRAAWQTPDGIIFADVARTNEPKFRKMRVLDGTQFNTIEPLSISDNLDLTEYGFSKCVAYRWGDYEIFCVQKKTLGVIDAFNSVMFIHNTVSKQWDKLDYYATALVEFNGMLIAGDPLTNNALILFSGFDENGDVIPNYWTSTDLTFGMTNLKTVRRMVMSGLIQNDQSLLVQASYNGSAWATIFTIEGDADYVDTGIEISIGSKTIGSTVIGGGSTDETASPYEVDFPVNSDKFTDIRIRIEALGIGYVSVDNFTFKDIRNKGKKMIPSRTV
jgi:hypothetical protein